MDRPCLSECDRIEAPRLLADFRYRRNQLHLLPGALARHGPGMGPLHARGLRLRGEGPADRDPRSAARPREGRRQRPPRLLRADAPSPRRREARTPPPPAAAPASVPGSDDPPLPRRPAAGLHLRARASQQDLDDHGGVRPPTGHRGRIHDRGRAAPPPDLHVTSAMAYLRWHGHGQDPWYNYRYSEEELKSWVPRVQQVASQAETVYGFFNNHFHGYAPENCIDILRMLGVQTQEQARALQRIDGFRKQTMAAEVRLRSLTLEDFGADVPKDALVEAALGRFMDRNRLDRAKRIQSRDVEISRDGESILARVKDYRIELDPVRRSILHDCEDWGKLVDRKDFCKHVGKFFLTLPKAEALALLEAIAADRDSWTFSTKAR